MRRSILLILLPVCIFAQTAEDIARNTETKLRSYRSLRANFEQIYYSSTITTPLKEKGKIYLQKPGWMRWEYEDPEKKIFLLKDLLYQAYFPDDNQLVQSTFSEEENESEVFTLLSGRKGILEHYEVEISPFPTNEKKVHQIKLTPREEDADTFILLEINAETWLITKAIFFDWAGNKQEFHFNKIKTNVNLPKNTFELKVPQDVEIIK